MATSQLPNRGATILLASLLFCNALPPAQAGPPGRYRPGVRGESPDHGPHGPKEVYRPGHDVRVLPIGYRRLVVGGVTYYEQGGIYFQASAGGYVVVNPPSPSPVLVAPRIGSLAVTLPLGAVSITLGGSVLYRHGDVYYRPAPGGYVVVERPPEVVVVNAPQPAPVVVASTQVASVEVYTPIQVSGKDYFYKNGRFYKKSAWGYESVETPIGAVLSQPPTGCQAIWVNDNEYFYLNSTFYRKTPEGYAVVAAPENAYVKSLPKNANTVHVHGHKFFYLDGNFYEQRDQGYLVTAPPVVLTPGQAALGTTLAAPPDGSVEVWVNETDYFYFAGDFYKKTPTGYIVVAPPL